MRTITRMTRGMLVLGLALAVTACDSYLDVNEDPNNPETVRFELTVPGMLVNFAHDVLGPMDIRYNNMVGPVGWGPEWMQQWSDNRDRHTYSQFQWYQVDNAASNSYWNNSYSRVMNEAKNIMNAAAMAERWQHHGMAKLITAWNMALLSDAFGPIPFNEALDPGNRDPAYDSQEAVYAGVFRMIDEAIEEFRSPDPSPPSANDILFQGDMDSWVRLANSLKGRLNMRLAYAPGENTQQRAQAALDALAQGIRSPEQAPVIEYAGDEAEQRQPWYTYGYGSIFARTRSSESFIEMLKDDNDPRLPVFAEPAGLLCPERPYSRDDCEIAEEVTDEPVFRGNRSGSPGEPDSAISRLGEFFVGDASPHVWFTYEDTKFLEAEARLLVSGAGAADAPYREGVRANMERLGVEQADIDEYMAGIPPLGSQGNPLEEIMTEKAKANFLRDEVWHDWRRTGFPHVEPVPEAELAGIPVRLRTPASEMERNAANVAATGISTGQDGMLVPVWWASGQPQTF